MEENRKRMRRLKAREIVLVFLAIAAISMAVVAIHLWNAPLDSALELPTLMFTSSNFDGTVFGTQAPVNSTPTKIAGVSLSVTPDLTSTLISGVPIAGTPESNPSPRPTRKSKPLCGGPSVMTILAIGSDSRQTGYLYGLSDVIRIVRIDFSVPRVTVLEFPRDLWVEIPEISDHYGITHGKLNQAYLFGNPGMGYYDGPAGGPGLLARTLLLNFGLRVDHYLAMDRQTFVKVVDAVGGVDVYLEEAVNANMPGKSEQTDLYFMAGTNHLNGEQALLFASNRMPSTFQRAKYQNMILSALQDKILNPSVLPDLPKLINSFKNSVQLDLSPNLISKLVCLVPKLTAENTVFVSFPEEIFKPSSIYDPYRKTDTFVLDVDFDLLRYYVASFMNDTWPSP